MNLEVQEVRVTVGADEHVLPFGHVQVGEVSRMKLSDYRSQPREELIVDEGPRLKRRSVDPVMRDSIAQAPTTNGHWTDGSREPWDSLNEPQHPSLSLSESPAQPSDGQTSDGVHSKELAGDLVSAIVGVPRRGRP
jgi:hypothetical protein